MKGNSESHSISWTTLLLLVTTMITNVASIVLGFLNSIKNGFFRSVLNDLLNKYPTENNPQITVGVVVFIVMYTFNTFTIGFLLISALLKPSMCPVTNSSTIIPKRFLLCCNVAFLSSIAWSFLFDKENLAICAGLQINAEIFLWIGTFILFRSFPENFDESKGSDKKMLWLIRILMHNASCLFSTWAYVTSNIGFSIALVYKNSYGQANGELRGLFNPEDGSTVGLMILITGVTVLFILDVLVFEKYFRYIFVIFPVFIFTFGGIIANMHLKNVGFNIHLAFLGMTISMAYLVAKITLLIVRLGNNEEERDKKLKQN